jgi:hypothetical protein
MPFSPAQKFGEIYEIHHILSSNESRIDDLLSNKERPD